MKSPTADRLLSLAELADYLGWSTSTIYNRRYRGADLPRSIRIGGQVRYRLSDVEQWLETNADRTSDAVA